MKCKELSRNAAPNEVRSTYTVRNLTVNVKSCFYPEKSLSDTLFSIASVKIKEKQKLRNI